MGNLITNVDSFDGLARAIRSGNACIPITELSGGDDRIPKSCFGSLVVEGDETELRLRSTIPLDAKGVMDTLMLYSEYRPLISSLKCTINGSFPVLVQDSSVSSSCPAIGLRTSVSLRFITIKALTEEYADRSSDCIRMHARIDRSELHFNNLNVITTIECSQIGELKSTLKRNGLGGEIPPYRYTIRAEGTDIQIEVGLLSSHSSPSSESDHAFMEALVTTLVWANGGHPRIYHSTHWRDEKLLKAEIHPLENVIRSRPRLVQPMFGVDAADKIMNCGIKFFHGRTPLARDLKLLLWQYRDATAEGPIGLGMLLQACTLLEGVVGLTLRHSKKLSTKAIDQLRMKGDSKVTKRKSCATERFFHAGEHLGFDWEHEFKPVAITWSHVRNALAHGDIGKIDFTKPEAILESYRQIIQAFNAVALKLIGYPGKVVMDKGWYPIP